MPENKQARFNAYAIDSSSYQLVDEVTNQEVAIINSYDEEAATAKERATLLVDSLNAVNPRSVDPLKLDDSDVEDLAEDALNIACLMIQNRIGQGDGGLAGIVFSDDEVKNKFAEYIRAEIDRVKAVKDSGSRPKP